MASEGEFPKIDGDVLFASEANKMFTYAFQNEAQNRYAIIYDSDVTEFNTKQADGWVAGFEVLSSSGGVDTGATTMMYDSLVGYFTGTLLDTFATGTVNSAIWTTAVTGGGTVTESSGKLKIDSGGTNGDTASARTQGSGPGFDARTADSTILVHSLTITASGDSNKIRVSNGTTAVDIYTFPTDAAETERFIEIYFDVSEETARVRVKTSKTGMWGAWSATVDISSVTSNWYVDFIMTTGANGGSGSFHLADVWYVKGAVTQVLVSDGYDHLQTATSPAGVITLDHGIFTANKELAGGVATWSLSSNDGSAFSTATEDAISTISSASNQLVLKASIVSAADRPAYIYEFGVKAWD